MEGVAPSEETVQKTDEQKDKWSWTVKKAGYIANDVLKELKTNTEEALEEDKEKMGDPQPTPQS
jgi:hypothetical protein